MPIRLLSSMRYTPLALCASAAVLFSVSAAGQGVTTKSDESWLSVTGKATQVNRDGFVLNYKNGRIPVEMDDWDEMRDVDFIQDGDRVTVYGRIDDSLYETRTIEAASVYLPDKHRYVRASARDEEGDIEGSYYYHLTLAPSDVTVSGNVERIDGRELVLDTGSVDVRVDTIEMAYNPLDDAGVQVIEVGDRISVVGELNEDFFDNAGVDAHSIVTVEES